MDRKTQIENLVEEAYEESKKEVPDMNKINQIKRKILNLGIGLNFNDINKR